MEENNTEQNYILESNGILMDEGSASEAEISSFINDRVTSFIQDLDESLKTKGYRSKIKLDVMFEKLID